MQTPEHISAFLVLVVAIQGGALGKLTCAGGADVQYGVTPMARLTLAQNQMASGGVTQLEANCQSTCGVHVSFSCVAYNWHTESPHECELLAANKAAPGATYRDGAEQADWIYGEAICPNSGNTLIGQTCIFILVVDLFLL